MNAEAEFRSSGAAGYFSTMVRHFGHKIPVTEDGGTARLEFSCGVAEIQLLPGELRMRVTATAPDLLAETCDVIERHLLRFAFREEPGPLDWQVFKEE